MSNGGVTGGRGGYGGGGAPSGPAGGGLGGTYPDPSVNDDGHNHTAATLPADLAIGPATSADNAAARFNGTDNKTLQDSDFFISDTASNTVTVSVDDGTAATHLEIKSKGAGYVQIEVPGNNSIYLKTNGATKWSIDGGGVLKIQSATSRLELQGGLVWKGNTTSVLPVTTSDIASGEIGIHKDTNLNTRTLVWNDGGVLYGVTLAAL